MQNRITNPKTKTRNGKKKFAIYESGIVQTLIRSMYGTLVYFLEITTLTQLFKISRTVGLLSKFRHFFPFSTLISIYHSLIAPYLRYALIAWGQASKSQLNKLLQQSFRNALFALFTLLNREIMPFLSLSIQKYLFTN